MNKTIELSREEQEAINGGGDVVIDLLVGGGLLYVYDKINGGTNYSNAVDTAINIQNAVILGPILYPLYKLI